MTAFALSPLDTLLVALVVLFVGRELARRVPALERSNVPHAVFGGVLCALVVLGLRQMADVEVRFAPDLRDVLLLAFFVAFERMRARSAGAALATAASGAQSSAGPPQAD